jgi:spore coat protein U-like protein
MSGVYLILELSAMCPKNKESPIEQQISLAVSGRSRYRPVPKLRGAFNDQAHCSDESRRSWSRGDCGHQINKRPSPWRRGRPVPERGVGVVKRYLLAVLVAWLLAGMQAPYAHASTVTQNLGVSATVQATCTLGTPGTVAFGTYIPTAASTATAAIQVTCTNSTPYNIGLNAGLANGATVTTRQMQNGANLLNYGLYQDSGHTQNWGNTVGTDTVAGVGNGSLVSTTVYGNVPAGQYVVPGNYTDTVQVTVTY